MKLVSVIVPVYNMEEYVESTLTSIIESDYPHLEVIVVDDGSTDNSVSIINNIANKDKRIKLICQKNSGVCIARNNGIIYAKGFYILPVDADDLIHKHFISEAVNIMEQDDQIKGVAPRAEYIGGRTGEYNLPDFNLQLMARKNIVNNCGLYRKSDAMEFNGYSEVITFREDWDFWINMMKHGGKIVKTKEIRFYYRKRENSKRIQDRKFKKELIEALNQRHPAFFEKYLGGPLRFHRTWSKLRNKIEHIWIKRYYYIEDKKYDYLKYFFLSLPISMKDAISGERCFHVAKSGMLQANAEDVYVVIKFKDESNISKLSQIFSRQSLGELEYQKVLALYNAQHVANKPIGFMRVRKGFVLVESYMISKYI